MAEYAKKTVAELQEILKSRSLPSSGKKAELIARLNESDKEAAAAEQTAEIAEPAAVAAAEPAQPDIPVTTSQDAATESAPADSNSEQPVVTADDTAEAGQPSPDTTLAAQTNYSLNLPTSSLDNELAKRKARAERFGTGAAAPAETAAEPPANGDTAAPEVGAEALKNLERAKRFGTGQTAIGKLDEALSSESLRGSRKRGHGAVAEGGELDDPGLKRSFANRGRGRVGRSRGRGSRGATSGAAAAGRPQGVQKSGANPAFTSEKDRLAAEARKKKFATA